MKVEIDKDSGFCAGVIKAIETAEELLDKTSGVFSLGAIVHNEQELARLESKGLGVVKATELDRKTDGSGKTLLIRAHGEPPWTYSTAKAAGFEIVDCTCPVVLKLQREIKEADARRHSDPRGGMIVIFGKPGHPEVLGLLGQAGGRAVVIENLAMLQEAVQDGKIDLRKPVEIFSQTTKSPSEYSVICSRLEEMMATANEFPIAQFKGRRLLLVHNTICSQVSSRYYSLPKFAANHDIIIFVAGKASSNGKVLCDLCKSANIRTYHISSPNDLRHEWFAKDDSVGICGATSTPRWLLDAVAASLRDLFKN